MLKSFFSVLLVIVFSNATTLEKNNYQIGMEYLHGDRGVVKLTKKVRNCEEDEEDECIDRNKPKDALVNIEVKQLDIKSAIHYLYKASLGGSIEASDALVRFLTKNSSYKQDKLFLNSVLSKKANLTKKKFFEILFYTMKNGSKKSACDSNYFEAEFLSNGYLGHKKNKKLANKYYRRAYKFCDKTNIYHYLSEFQISKNGKK